MFLFLLIVSVNTHSFSQKNKHFSTDHDVFINQIDSVFSSRKSKYYKDKAEKLLPGFKDIWNNNAIILKIKDKIIENSNLMLDNKMSIFPYFYDYFLLTLKIAQTNHSQNSFLIWQSSLKKLIEGEKKKVFLQHLKKINNLFDENILYKTNLLVWKTSNKNFKFKYDSVLKIKFNTTNLICKSGRGKDSIINTRGIFFPLSDKWIGNKGKALYDGDAFHKSKIYVVINDYKISLKQSRYYADSVLYYNENLFSNPLLGRFENKVYSSKNDRRFPVFEAYDKKVTIKSVFPDISYSGGFSMQGNKIIGFSTNDVTAKIILFKNNREKAIFKSRTFIISSDKISSSKASAILYLDNNNDSIFHPCLFMKYNNINKEISLLRYGKGLSSGPFYDSYHNLEIFCESMFWKINEPEINMKMKIGLSRESKADFESVNSFYKNKYYSLQGLDALNPLVTIKNFAKGANFEYFYLQELVDYMNKPKAQVEALVVRLANLGFLIYDSADKKFIVKDKLYHYIDSENGKVDYDVISFKSVVKNQSNAVLNLKNNNLKIMGVSVVSLSDVQNVYIFPENSEISVNKDLNFVFTGRVHAGLFDFYANECSFEYDSFRLSLPTVDSLKFSVHRRKKDKNGFSPFVKVKSVISDINGELLIDRADNKSGLKSLPQYPVFIANKNSYVYFDSKSIENGVYKKDKFYYEIFPFAMDSLLTFTTDGLSFDGSLFSAGIFPPINTPLKVQDDYSLGIETTTPKSGLPIYDSLGVYFNEISLSNKGFKGNGKINFLSSYAIADTINFYPDSLIAIADTFKIKEFVEKPLEFPEASAQNVFIKWQPQKDIMCIENNKKPFKLFKDKTDFSGKLLLTSSKLKGSGKLTFKDVEFYSNQYKFKHLSFESDTTDFNINAFDKSGMVFKSHVYKTNIDFETNTGVFQTGVNDMKIDFSVNKFYAFMNKFIWHIDKDEIELFNDFAIKNNQLNTLSKRELIDVDFKDFGFLSYAPDKDSLRFYSSNAVYNFKDNIIEANDVKYIRVADAAVFPENNKVVINKTGDIKTLSNASLIANVKNKYFQIDDAEINISSRKKYSAKGYYNYFCEEQPGLIQKIYFNDINVDAENNTYALSKISDSTEFSLNPHFQFYGNVILNAKNKYLNFDGYFKLNDKCNYSENSWVKFNSDINPENIYFPLDSVAKNNKNYDVYAGLFFSKKYKNIYPAILNKPYSPDDIKIFSSCGSIRFNKKNNSYEIADKDRLKFNRQSGNYLSIDQKKCILKGEGNINLCDKKGIVNIKTLGSFNHYIIPDSTDFDLSLFIDFPFSDKAMDIIYDSLKIANLKGVNLSDKFYVNNLSKIVDANTLSQMKTEVSLYGAYKKVPAALQKSFVISKAKFVWNKILKSYISYGQVGITIFNGKQINKYVDAIIEIAPKSRGNMITIYLSLNKRQWVMFSYYNNLMQAVSSNINFNNVLIGIKPNKRVFKDKESGNEYEYIISTTRKKNNFIRKINAVYNKN